jgi:hypothetical protein
MAFDTVNQVRNYFAPMIAAASRTRMDHYKFNTHMDEATFFRIERDLLLAFRKIVDKRDSIIAALNIRR